MEMCAASFPFGSVKLPRSELIDGVGSGFSRAAVAFGSLRMAAGNACDDVWYNMERFQLDHISEVINKLEEGEIDDEIWGKIIVMERGRRIAKAYLRKTTIIVDGGAEEFDGQTLGFNQFANPLRDEYTDELRSKIGDGVIIKIDNQGNIKAMARGSTPIIVQGTTEPELNCISERLIREQGRLKTRRDQTAGAPDEERIAKIFDMRRFKSAIVREMGNRKPHGRELLMKTCVRIALVKDGGSDPMKTPCWFMIINLVALDMLMIKVPRALNFYAHLPGNERLSKMASLMTLAPMASNTISQGALSGLITAALQQADDQFTGTRYGHISGSIPVLNQVDQLAHLANTLRLARNTAINKRTRRNNHRSRSCSDTDDSVSSMEFSRRRARCHSVLPTGTTSSSASSSGISAANTRTFHTWDRLSSVSLKAVYEDTSPETYSHKVCGNVAMRSNNSTTHNDAVRKRNDDSNDRQRHNRPQQWPSCTSTTSDYDSNRELYDSASCCSISCSSSLNLNRCHSSPLLSEGDETDSTAAAAVHPHAHLDGYDGFCRPSPHKGMPKATAQLNGDKSVESLHTIQNARLPEVVKHAPSAHDVSSHSIKLSSSNEFSPSPAMLSSPEFSQSLSTLPVRHVPLSAPTPHVRRKSKFHTLNPFARLFRKDQKQKELQSEAFEIPETLEKSTNRANEQQNDDLTTPRLCDRRHSDVISYDPVDQQKANLGRTMNVSCSRNGQQIKLPFNYTGHSSGRFPKSGSGLCLGEDEERSRTFLADAVPRIATIGTMNKIKGMQAQQLHNGQISETALNRPFEWDKTLRVPQMRSSNDKVEEIFSSSTGCGKMRSAAGFDGGYRTVIANCPSVYPQYGLIRTGASCKSASQLLPITEKQMNCEMERTRKMTSSPRQNMQEIRGNTKNCVMVDRSVPNMSETETVRKRGQRPHSSILPTVSEAQCASETRSADTRGRLNEAITGQRTNDGFRSKNSSPNNYDRLRFANETKLPKCADAKHIIRLVVD